MNADSLAFLERLMSVPCPSGFEQPAQRIISARLEKYADRVWTDVHGNVISVINEGAPLRIMFAGHADEIGFMVTHIDEKGYVYAASIGGNDQTLCAGMRVNIHGPRGPVLGVFGKKPIHLMRPDERDKAHKLRDLWSDIGAKDRKDAEKCVEVGDPITYTVGFERLLNNIAVARAFDNRAGCFCVCEAMRLLARNKQQVKVSVYGVSTVQEEIGLRGARTSTFGIDPHVGIALDVEWATDHPSMDEKEIGSIALGGGPVLAKGANINPVALKRLRAAAKKAKVPYQMVASPGATGTDANAIQVTRSGVATALIGIPNRYMHTPVELIHLDDLDNTAKLLARFAQDLTPKTSFIPT